jgi:hypothetical protein
MSSFKCSRCREYNDPQALDYNSGLCFACQDGEIPVNLIKELSERQSQLFMEIDLWYVEYVKPRIDCCSSKKELDLIWHTVLQACKYERLPGHLEIERVFSYRNLSHE